MKVLLSGYYGYGNLGDEAIASAMASALVDAGHEVTILSADPAATRSLHGVNAVHRYRALLPALARTDVVISGGGGLLQDHTSSRSLAYYLWVLRISAWLGKKRIVYGQSIGPLSPQGKRRVAAELRAVPVAVRDNPSRVLLAGLGIEASLVADAALALPRSHSDDPASEDQPVLLIPRGGHSAATEVLAEVARQLTEQGEAVAVLALHPAQDDAELIRLKTLAGKVRRLSASTPSTAVAAIQKARHVVSVRLHGLIFAALARRPFSGIAYDPKVTAFLTATGAPSHGALPDADALLAEVKAHRTAESDKLEKLDAHVDRARRGLDWLLQQIEAAHPEA